MAALTVTQRRDLSGYLITGPGSAAALDADGLPRPREQLAAAEQDGALVARTGADEYLLFLPGDRQPPADCWCFSRADRVLAVHGDDWRELLARVCQYDFRHFGPGDWLMASLAGVNAWLYRTQEDGTLLVGVSDGFHRYLEDLFSDLVCELEDSATYEGGAS
ncbi:hypothetical protein [Marinobacter bohaiensis]|uniref:hypothetical protein n=1 Tax=Marinobacter bohaiensis TaxID=2201898 RepID=UPI000DABF66C|nr:hypothetical protein [Marinobacter bohaiensis]